MFLGKMDSSPPPVPPQPPNSMVEPNFYPTIMPHASTTSPSSSMINSSSAAMNPPVRFPFNSVTHPPPKPLDSFTAAAVAASSGPYDGSSPALRPCGFNIDPVKKKRGRPRKYAGDGNNIALGLSPTPVSSSLLNHGGDSTPSSEPCTKKSRGRPPGSGKKQLKALGAGGVGFTPHVITVKVGEDIASKIMDFSQQGPRTVCILSAHGAIYNVTLRQPAMSVTVTHEGRFEIISLSGSFLLPEHNGSGSRNGGLSVCLAGSDGRVLGGGVAGMLRAATPVQVIVGSFIEDGKKSNSSISITKSGPSTAPTHHMLSFGGPVAAASPSSQGVSSESSDDQDNSPLNGSSGLYSNNASQPNHGMYHLWPGQPPQ